jgi:hypothetical protein
MSALPERHIAAENNTQPVRVRTLVMYHFFEKDQSYVKNLAHFLLFGYSDDCDYLIIVAGAHTISLPRRNNVQYLFTENKNNDYGGYCSAITALGDEVSRYDQVFFVNSSVRGPFLPPGAAQNWQQIFETKLTGEVGLVGSTINILSSASLFSRIYKARYGGREPFSHVQTMSYVLSRAALQYLRESGFYANWPALDKNDVIVDYELELSQRLLRGGWNISALLPEYATIDYRGIHAEINLTSSGGDPSIACRYFGRSAHPFEVLFIKTNREIFHEAYLDRLAYSALLREKPSLEWDDDALIADYVSLLETIPASTECAPVLLNQYPAYSIDAVLGLTQVVLDHYPSVRKNLLHMLRRSKRE